MKKNIVIHLIALFALCLLLSNAPSAEQLATPDKDTDEVGEQVVHDFDTKKNTILIKAIFSGLKRAHYQPLPINDDFSVKVFDLYLKRVDFSKRFLLKSDIANLEKYKIQIDNQLKRNEFDFVEATVQLLKERTAEAEQYYKDILAQPFQFDKDENYETDAEKRTYATSEAELKERWRKSLKYQTLTRLVNALEAQEKTEDPTQKEREKTIKTFDELEKEAREKVLETHDNWFKRMSRLTTDDRFSIFLNAIAGAHDPHTSYLPPAEKENFDIGLSGRLEGIGARLSESDGAIKVTHIVPGSASWQQGELKEEDLILKVAQGEEEPIDVVDMRLRDAVKLIRGPKGTEVRLTVKKIDGTIKVIPIIRDVVVLEESYAKSSILQKEGSDARVGYLNLPKFYADFNDRENGRNCADDVKQEIAKLKEENIDGLIIDLRNNGGGSLRHVVRMAGMFVDQGPIVQVKPKVGEPDIFEDPKGGIDYDGPMAIMVNSFSASASEILAAAMQDYERAIVVGSPSTFGKGTVQRFIDLDRIVPPEYDDVKPLGSIKLTIQKFYRIDGGTNQLKGVHPDIVLPDRYTYIDVGEKEQEFAMPFDEIAALNYQHWHLPTDIRLLKNNSDKRVAENKTFQLVDENARRLKEQRDKTTRTLCYDKYLKERKAVEASSKKYEDIDKEITGFDAETLKYDVLSMEEDPDTSRATRAEAFNKEIEKDVYIYETMAIVEDMNMSIANREPAPVMDPDKQK